MDDVAADWPRKTREMQNHHMDSTVWNGFAMREGDVVVATYAKAGTTWVQQICGQLIFQGREDFDIQAISPWIDLRIAPAADVYEAQTHRRIIKTHLAADALDLSPAAKFLYVARDGRDVAWSFYHHTGSLRPEIIEAFNNTPGRVGPPLPPQDPDIRSYFLTWLEQDGYPYWPFFDHVRGWWDVRGLPNVRLVHFNRLKADLAGEMRAIADFLEVDVPLDLWPTLIEHCSFEYMKANAAKVAPRGGIGFQGGAETFINRGTNGRWQAVLTQADCRAYEQRALEALGCDCAHWLATGEA